MDFMGAHAHFMLLLTILTDPCPNHDFHGMASSFHALTLLLTLFGLGFGLWLSKLCLIYKGKIYIISKGSSSSSSRVFLWNTYAFCIFTTKKNWLYAFTLMKLIIVVGSILFCVWGNFHYLYIWVFFIIFMHMLGYFVYNYCFENLSLLPAPCQTLTSIFTFGNQ